MARTQQFRQRRVGVKTSRVLRTLAIRGVLSLGCSSASKAPDVKIAIVGAGASGLMAVHTLARLGYTKVTVFERNDRIDGKVHLPDPQRTRSCRGSRT